jgi:hypothetical protein
MGIRPRRGEPRRLKKLYFKSLPTDANARLGRGLPPRVSEGDRYSDYNQDPPSIVEFDFA